MRELGQAPELTYEASACNIALAAMEVTPEHASYGYDTGGIGDSHLRGCQALHRTEQYVDYNTVLALREARLEQRISRRQIADDLDLPPHTLQGMEMGRHQMTVMRAVTIAEYLGVDLGSERRAIAPPTSRHGKGCAA